MKLVKSVIFSFIVILGLNVNQSYACTFTESLPFLTAAKDSSVIVLGSVLSREKESLVLSVENILLGQESKTEIRIWLGDHSSCMAIHEDAFPVGSNWVLALRHFKLEIEIAEPESMNSRQAFDYSMIDGANGRALPVENGMVIGNIGYRPNVKLPERLSIEQLHRLLFDLEDASTVHKFK